MDRFQRLIVCALVALCSASSFAATYAPTIKYVFSGGSWSADWSSACASAYAAQNAANAVIGGLKNYAFVLSPLSCKADYVAAGAGAVPFGPGVSSPFCLPGDTYANGMCTAAVVNDPCVSKAGSKTDMQAPWDGGSMNTTLVNLCEPLPASAGTVKYPGCSVTVFWDFAAGGSRYGVGTYGAGCTPGTGDGSAPGVPATASTPTAPVAGAPAPSPCAAGTYSGTVNGLPSCINANGDKNVVKATPIVKDSATSAGGSASAPTSGLGANAPPTATSATKETLCTSSACTTTTSYKNAAGESVGTSKESKPVGSFCSENPAASICVRSSLSGTPCGGSDSCSGDAIQCAIEAQVKATACALTTAPIGDANITAFNTAAAQSQGDQTAGITSVVNIGPGAFDQSDALGGTASGLVDQVVSIAGQSVTIPWSQMNVLLERIGLVMQAVTFLWCARIVMRG